MTNDEIKKLEAERYKASAALQDISHRLCKAREDKAAEDMAAIGVSIGDAVEVLTNIHGDQSAEKGVLVGFDVSIFGYNLVIMKMKKDGSAAKSGRVHV